MWPSRCHTSGVLMSHESGWNKAHAIPDSMRAKIQAELDAKISNCRRLSRKFMNTIDFVLLK